MTDEERALLADVRKRLEQCVEVEDQEFGDRSLSVYLPGGDVHVSLGDSPRLWTWWIVTLDDEGIPHSSDKYPLTPATVDRLFAEIEKLRRTPEMEP